MRALVISPHLDDAVLSLGGALTHSTIVTMLAGFPPEWYWPTPFDNASGFSDSIDAVAGRRAEDRAAAAELDSQTLHLRFLDGQYGLPPDKVDLRVALWWAVKNRPETTLVAVPLGLAHPDHRMIAAACRYVMRDIGNEVRWLVYADLPSAQLYRGHEAGALRGWARAGFTLTPTVWPVDLDRKRRAVERYESQRRFEALAFENLIEEHGWMATPTLTPAD